MRLEARVVIGWSRCSLSRRFRFKDLPGLLYLQRALSDDVRHRITNAASESLNAKIQWVKYTARGCRNKQNFIHAIYFHCGGLDLAPSSTK
jgi:hypothetical protein